jgi:hypothetical protein
MRNNPQYTAANSYNGDSVMTCAQRYISICFTVVLFAWMPKFCLLRADEYVELISSFETEADASMFTYDANDKGWAKVSNERASHGKNSLKVRFLITEAEAEAKTGGLRAFLQNIIRSIGIFSGGEDAGKLALLGRSLPFDWTGVDALVFDAYNPANARLELSMKVKSGMFKWDPTAKLYRTKVTLAPKKWTPVRLSPKAMGTNLHPAGIIDIRLMIPAKGMLYVDNVRFAASVKPKPETKYVRLTWTQDPRTTQTITWQSRAETAVVRFGPQGELLSRRIKAESKPIFAWAHGIFHEATLTNLGPDTTYEYQIRSGDSAWTTRKSFLTAPASDEAVFTFIAGSDTKGGRQVMIDLLKVFERDDPRFMIYAGDAVHTGGLSPHWNRWFQAVEPFTSNKSMMLSVGNHGVGDDPNLVNFKIFNALPTNSGSEVYYSFDYGPVHFVCLDTESGLYPEQIPWIEKDLAATKKPWKVAYFHSPPFSSGTAHGSNEELRRVIGPIFSKHHVNLVLSGHDHLYERSKPINLLMSKNAPVSSYKDGSCYIISAGAGAGLYDARAGNWWTAALKTKIHHLCRIKVNGSKSMRLEAVSIDGRIIDSITLENLIVRR